MSGRCQRGVSSDAPVTDSEREPRHAGAATVEGTSPEIADAMRGEGPP
jgi:hypothetical protein